MIIFQRCGILKDVPLDEVTSPSRQEWSVQMEFYVTEHISASRKSSIRNGLCGACLRNFTTWANMDWEDSLMEVYVCVFPDMFRTSLYDYLNWDTKIYSSIQIPFKLNSIINLPQFRYPLSWAQCSSQLTTYGSASGMLRARSHINRCDSWSALEDKANHRLHHEKRGN